MARLVHLNGPPGVGKSTIARAYAADHPMTLALDADVVVAMIGGWQDCFWETLSIARGLCAAMVGAHLAHGHDVVLPQLVTSAEEIAPYLAVVEGSAATYVEVVLLAAQDVTDARFSSRGTDPMGRHIQDIVAANGGPELLAKIRGDLLTHLAGRRDHVVIDTTGQTTTQTYLQVRRALGD